MLFPVYIWRWILFTSVFIGIIACTPEQRENPIPEQSVAEQRLAAEEESTARNILFLGNSLSAGFGVNLHESFPSLIREKIESAGLDFQVSNAGLSGDTSAGGLRRIGWLLQSPVDVLVLELGGNDGLRGLDVSSTQQNLSDIIDKVTEANPDCAVVLAGMQVPANLGRDYTTAFSSMYTNLARKHDLVLIPFLLEGVGGVPELNLPDRIHPTPEGHRIIAETVWKYLEPVLRSFPERAS